MDISTFPFVYPPMKHQKEEFVEHRDTFSRALLWDPGVGKSKAAIDKMVYLYLTGKVDTVVIMAKKGEYTNWKYVELPEHMPPSVDYQCEVYRSGLKSEEKAAIRRLVAAKDKLRILNINIESVTYEGGQLIGAFLKTSKRKRMFILDESSAAKNHKSVRSKAVYKFADACQYKLIMTGTFSPNSPLDAWGQSLVLGKGILGTTSYLAFKSEFCVEQQQYFGARSFKKIVGYRNLDELHKRITTFASIKERSECFDLPPKIYKKVALDMTDEQQSAYTDMRDMALAQFGDNLIVEAVSAMDIIAKLDQIAVGQIKLDDGTFKILNNNRVEALLSRLEDTTKKGIIWCNYRGMLEHIYDQIRLNFGDESVAPYYGGVRDEVREEAVRDFQDQDKPLRWIVANQQSLGYGRTLTTGKENYYVSNNYNLEHRLQSEDRTMRLGQTESVLYTDFYARGTVNEKIYVALRAKKNMMAEILGTSIRNWI
jgi:SNF2 family DNA or RNA helicase